MSGILTDNKLLKEDPSGSALPIYSKVLKEFLDQINDIKTQLDNIYLDMSKSLLALDDTQLLDLLNSQLFAIPREVLTHVFINCNIYSACKLIFTNIKADKTILNNHVLASDAPEWKEKLLSNWILVSRN